MVNPKPIQKIIFPDKNDHFLLELAVTAKASMLITGDQKLLHLEKAESIEILNPSQFCKKLKIK